MDESQTTQQSLEINGFRFLTAQDAEKAKVDAGKIGYIESHVGYTTTTALHAVYEKSIQNKIFSTPVGWTFLQDLRKRLIKMGMPEEEIEAIPMTVSFTHTPIETEAPVKEPVKKERDASSQKPPLIILSVALNLLLVVMLVVMFVILNFGETDNMINYKRNLQNRYAAYEQELKEREQIIREKERELNINQ